jgi:hypothetical protein
MFAFLRADARLTQDKITILARPFKPLPKGRQE